MWQSMRIGLFEKTSTVSDVSQVDMTQLLDQIKPHSNKEARGNDGHSLQHCISEIFLYT